MTDASIPCSCCKGTGHRHLSPQYADTLKTLREIGPASCGAVADRMKKMKLIKTSKGTLIYKRMDRMERLGLVRKLPMKELSVPGTNYKASLFEAV